MEELLNPLEFLRLLASVLLISILGLLFYPQVRSKFRLYYKANGRNEKIIQRCPTIKQGFFFPTIYLGTGGLQAFFGGKSKYHDPNIEFDKEIIDLPDKAVIALHWGRFLKPKEHTPKHKKDAIVILVPGLTASSNEPYIRNISTEALENGYQVVVYHQRGN